MSRQGWPNRSRKALEGRSVAFLGLGYAATVLHLPAVRALGGGVGGGADPSPERRADWRQRAGGPVFDDAADLLESVRPDIAVIATPPETHADLAIAALDAGAHVICEKPFTRTLEDSERVLARGLSAGRHVVLNHEFRFMPIFAVLADVVGSPEVGRPVFLQCLQYMDLAPWDEQVAWRAAMSDRALFEGGVHVIDLLLMIVGRLPETVTAATSSGLDAARDADAIHLVTLDFGGGLLAQVTLDRLCPAGTRYVELRIDCERASIRSSMGGRALVQIGLKRAQRPGLRLEYGLGGLAWAERGLRRKTLARNARRAATRATAALYQATFEAIGRGEEPPTHARIGRDALLVIDAAYRSAASGQAIPVEAAGSGLLREEVEAVAEGQAPIGPG